MAKQYQEIFEMLSQTMRLDTSGPLRKQDQDDEEYAFVCRVQNANRLFLLQQIDESLRVLAQKCENEAEKQSRRDVAANKEKIEPICGFDTRNIIITSGAEGRERKRAQPIAVYQPPPKKAPIRKRTSSSSSKNEV